MLKNGAGALALCLAAVTVLAQPALRLKDVNQRTSFGSNPQQFVTVGGVTYFVATDEAHGGELWRTDGTPTGTQLVKDIVPGSGSSAPWELTDFGGSLYFVANGTLFRSNGTPGGTTRFRADLKVAAGESLAVHAGRLYFAADDGASGRELWRTDGTDAGTSRVADIVPGPAGSDPLRTLSAGGLLYFTAEDAAGRELWRTDGTAAGTLRILDIRPGPAWSNPGSFTVAGAQLFFTADDGVHGRELWATGFDSTVTALVRDIRPGPASSEPDELTRLGDLLLLAADDGAVGRELWRTDGSPAGTARVRDLIPGPISSSLQQLTVLGSALYFVVDHPNAWQLWRTDGTDAGTVMITDPFASSRPMHLTAHAGALFFSANEGGNGLELWTSDGTAAGTVALDLRPGAEGSSPWGITSTGGRLYFAAVPPQAPVALTAWEPWTSDGTVAGSALLRVIRTAASSSFTYGGALGGLLLSGADDGVHGQELWRSDGTEAGTWLLADLQPGAGSSLPSHFTPYQGALYFRATEAPGRSSLWRTDGSAAGTVRVSGPDTLGVGALVRSGALLFFDGRDAVHGDELWRSDGTTAGTVMVRDLDPGPSVQTPELLTDVNGTLFFSGSDPTEGYALWRSDGTAAGTVRVDAIYAGPGSADIRYLAAAGGLLFFIADDGLHGLEPWVSDGTPLGTRQVRDVRPGPEGSGGQFTVGANGLAFFSADDGIHGLEPWRSDGSEAGTILLADVRPGPLGSEPSPMARVGDSVLFNADEGGAAGRELWRSDGAPAGTSRVRDIALGPESSLARFPPVAEWGGWAFFAAADADHGQELWRSDGTAAGTVMLQDIAPGHYSSAPQIVAGAGGRLFLTAVDETGREPWALLPGVMVANATAPEGTHALVDVALVPRLDVPLAVPFTTVDNSAVGGPDFLAKSGVLTFAPGETLQTVDITVLDDVMPETIEQFFVDIAPPAAFAAGPRGIVTVTDDDVAPALSVDDTTVVEGDTGTATASFTVRLAPVSAAPVSVEYFTATGTANVFDFDAATGTVTFPPGTTTRTVQVQVEGDVQDEPDEFFLLRLARPSGGVLADDQGSGRIADDDGTAIAISALDWGAELTATLAAAPGPGPDTDLYVVELAVGASYEVTVDAASGDLGDEGPSLERLDLDLSVFQTSIPLGIGHARTLRLSNAGPETASSYVRVRSAGCTTDCGSDDTYRIRLRETTGRVPRFNEAGGQRTVLILQNRSDDVLAVHALYWRGDGHLVGSVPAFIQPLGTLVLPSPATTQGLSGSISVLHAGGHGDLAGKAVSFDEATGLAFDIPLETRPR